MQTWKIGDVTITRIVEIELPGLSFVLPDAVPENLKAITWLKPHFVTEEWKPIASIHALVVESLGKRIIVDTCLGNDKNLPFRHWSRRQGPFLSDLKTAGFSRDSIDTIVCTHLHVDHVCWNTTWQDGAWVPTFPNAQYLFGRLEWAHWVEAQDELTTAVKAESIQPILDAGLHTLVENDHRITAEVWLEPTPGHTPGHVAVHIASKGEEAVITGDLMHHPCQIARSDWRANPDVDPQQAINTRRNFIRRYADTKTLVIGTHFATPTAGYIVRDNSRDEDTFRFQVR
jgi:glyoxylase-like metal-dependent hydrolase (beta-lactamase superfamily II)